MSGCVEVDDAEDEGAAEVEEEEAVGGGVGCCRCLCCETGRSAGVLGAGVVEPPISLEAVPTAGDILGPTSPPSTTTLALSPFSTTLITPAVVELPAT